MTALAHPMTTSVMSTAWALYRSYARMNKRIAFEPSYFAHCLRRAWMDHHSALRRAAYAAELAQMSPTERRVAAIEAEIGRLEYAGWAVDIAARRSELLADMAALTEPSNHRIAA